MLKLVERRAIVTYICMTCLCLFTLFLRLPFYALCYALVAELARIGRQLAGKMQA